MIEQCRRSPVSVLKLQLQGLAVTERSKGWGGMFRWARLCWCAWTMRREAPPRYSLAA